MEVSELKDWLEKQRDEDRETTSEFRQDVRDKLKILPTLQTKEKCENRRTETVYNIRGEIKEVEKIARSAKKWNRIAAAITSIFVGLVTWLGLKS